MNVSTETSASHHLILHHTRCHCGYDLRGLPETGTCPECGELIETTLCKQRSDAMWAQRTSSRLHLVASLLFACIMIPNATVAASGRQPELYALFQVAWLVTLGALGLLAVVMTIIGSRHNHGRLWLNLMPYMIGAAVFLCVNVVASRL